MSPRLLLLAAVVAAIAVSTSCSGDRAGTEAGRPATFVGRSKCATCHDAEHALWQGSHHDLAMQEATADTVLGDFDDREFTHHGVTSRFYRNGDKFMVRTDGPDGELTDYEIAYTFGVEPLQQYLIAFGNGRYQALSLLWDARPAEQGGQRWYHLYGNEPIPHTDELHWTGPSQNWNYMCAACHSTNLQKGYDLAADRFTTTWSEIDVSCEACHGAGSNHVAWAEAGGTANDPDNGLLVRLKQPHVWRFDEGAVTARRDPELAKHTQVETCAPCHSRGGSIDGQPHHGRPLLDSHFVALLDEGLYHADGQILDEVYVYGSFVQSKMYHSGVVCSDCHDPHSARLEAQGNALCAQCHLPSTFDTKAHHMHEPGSPGASCVACHMPERDYMGIDARADHSIRIPRPDLTVRLGSPNACNTCHDDKDARWADAAIRAHHGGDYEPRPHYGEAIHAGRSNRADAAAKLIALLTDAEQPAIARATAADLLQRRPSQEALTALQTALRDDSPHVRRGAIQGLESYPADLLPRLLAPLLDDPVRGVRTEAARALAASPVTGANRDRLAAVLDEYVESELVDADRPWSHTNIGLLRARQGRHAEAVAAYRQALAVDPAWIPAWANLADSYREQNRDDLAEPVLRDGLSRVRETAELRHALGLLLARNRRYDEAIVELRQAAELRPDNPQFAFAWAIALDSTEKTDRAIEVLEQAAQRHPRNRRILTALLTYHHEQGDRPKAIAWAQRLVALDPNDQEAAGLLRQLVEGR